MAGHGLGYSPPNSPTEERDFPDPEKPQPQQPTLQTAISGEFERDRERERDLKPRDRPRSRSRDRVRYPDQSAMMYAGGGLQSTHHYDSRTAEFQQQYGTQQYADYPYQSSYQSRPPPPQPQYPQPYEFFEGPPPRGRSSYPSSSRFPHSQHPKYKTVLCTHWVTESGCSRGTNCAFAHGQTDLRRGGSNPSGNSSVAGGNPVGVTGNNTLWRTQICRSWRSGECTYGSNCRFAHGADQLQGGPNRVFPSDPRQTSIGGAGAPTGMGGMPHPTGDGHHGPTDLSLLEAENKYLKAQVLNLKNKLKNCTCQSR